MKKNYNSPFVLSNAVYTQNTILAVSVATNKGNINMTGINTPIIAD